MSKILIQKGVNTQLSTRRNWNHVMFSCLEGHYKVTRLLIESGCDVGVRSTRGWTPLICASYRGHYDIVKFLLEEHRAKINIDESTTRGMNALIAASNNNYPKIVQLLISEGVERNAVTTKETLDPSIQQRRTDEVLEDDCTALMLASQKGNLDVVRILLKNSVNVSFKNKYGKTALMLSEESNHKEIYDMIKNHLQK